jgi:hypothetical protein
LLALFRYFRQLARKSTAPAKIRKGANRESDPEYLFGSEKSEKYRNVRGIGTVDERDVADRG